MQSKQVLARMPANLKNLQFSLKYSIISKYMSPKYTDIIRQHLQAPKGSYQKIIEKK